MEEFGERQDLFWIDKAIQLALEARAQGEVPIGAILTLNNIQIGSGYNQVIMRNDPTAHAEILALRAAGDTLNNYRLLNTTLYVTLEPCAMCAGAMVHARISRLVFGAFDLKTGAAGSVLKLLAGAPLNHAVTCQGGVNKLKCAQILSDFFKVRR